MPEFLNRFDNQTLLFAAIMLSLLFLLIVLVPLGMLMTWRQQRHALAHEHALKEQELALKREMLARGLSAAEIEQVVKATGGTTAPKPPPAFNVPGDKGPGFDKARLVAILIEQGIEADGVELILRAVADCADEELPAKIRAIANMAENGMAAPEIERVIRAFHRPKPPADLPPVIRQSAFRE